jgi:hypothetical protein
MSKSLAKSRTFWANLAMVVIGILGGVAGTEVIQENPILVGYFTSAMGVVNILLRIITKDPIK